MGIGLFRYADVLQQAATENNVKGGIGKGQRGGVGLAQRQGAWSWLFSPLFPAEFRGIDATSPEAGLRKALDREPIATTAVEHACLRRFQPVRVAELTKQGQVEVPHAMADADLFVAKVLKVSGQLWVGDH